MIEGGGERTRCRCRAGPGWLAKKGDMGKLLDGLAWLLGALLRLALWVLLLGLGLLLLLVALPLLLLGALWALLRGRRIAVPLAAELLRRRAQQMRARGQGWGRRGDRGGSRPGRNDEVVDVEVREVRELAPRPDAPPPGPTPPR